MYDITYSIMKRSGKVIAAAKNNPQSASFTDLLFLAESAGFVLRGINGSHRIYKLAGVPERLTLQPDGKYAKAYQVRQLLAVIAKYNIQLT